MKTPACELYALPTLVITLSKAIFWLAPRFSAWTERVARKATGVSFSTCRLRFVFVPPTGITLPLSRSRNETHFENKTFADSYDLLLELICPSLIYNTVNAFMRQLLQVWVKWASTKLSYWQRVKYLVVTRKKTACTHLKRTCVDYIARYIRVSGFVVKRRIQLWFLL